MARTKQTARRIVSLKELSNSPKPTLRLFYILQANLPLEELFKQIDQLIKEGADPNLEMEGYNSIMVLYERNDGKEYPLLKKLFEVGFTFKKFRPSYDYFQNMITKYKKDYWQIFQLIIENGYPINKRYEEICINASHLVMTTLSQDVSISSQVFESRLRWLIKIGTDLDLNASDFSFEYPINLEQFKFIQKIVFKHLNTLNHMLSACRILTNKVVNENNRVIPKPIVLKIIRNMDVDDSVSDSVFNSIVSYSKVFQEDQRHNDKYELLSHFFSNCLSYCTDTDNVVDLYETFYEELSPKRKSESEEDLNNNSTKKLKN